MKILFVTTDEFPNYGATTNLINKIVFDGDLKRKNSIAVLSIINGYSQAKCENYKGIRVFRAESLYKINGEDYRQTLRKMKFPYNVFSFIEKTLNFIYERGGNSVRLYRRIDSYRIRYALKYLVRKGFDVVIPVSGNYDAAAAVMSSGISAKKVFWQVDPCSSNWSRIKSEIKLSQRFEKNIGKIFDAVVTDELYYDALIEQIEPQDRSKVYKTNMPLISYKCNPESKRTPDNKISGSKCVFCGSIYAGIRDPEYTFRLFDRLNKENGAELHMYGVSKEDMTSSYLDSISFHGKIDMQMADEVVESADFLVNIGNVMTNQVPSKVFDYISTGKPIINVCKNRNCPTIELLKKYDNSITVFEEEALFEEQLRKIADFIHHNIGVRLSKEEVEDKYSEYRPSVCAGEFKRILNEIVQ